MAASYTAVYDAAIVYSEGEMGRLLICKHMSTYLEKLSTDAHEILHTV